MYYCIFSYESHDNIEMLLIYPIHNIYLNLYKKNTLFANFQHYGLYQAKRKQEQDEPSNIEQQPPLTRSQIKQNIASKGGGLQNKQEHHIILTKYMY